MSGQRAFNLLKTHQQSSDRLIDNFNAEDLRAVIEEIKVAFSENHQDALKFQETRDKSLFPMIGYRHALLQRNLRCTLAYLYSRLMKLKDIRWKLGPVINADIKESLTEAEIQWFNNYSRLLTNYMMSFPNGFNIMTDMKPPKSLFIEVKCLCDYGKFELENGESVALQKNSIHFLPRTECEHLIRQGILEHITN
ncbi:hypothetical protein PVAND_007141 [Polypedilum vanderplanki]|uniref:DNA replication complex GINS protein PSF1 n=1 Tax=Polypedilum vanderplanki TaxID=319348 RepID=A0A9J6C5H9_POLVA|nr:hypothetical protein PVAND_007141 [Polypedilum vanderplanki]